MVRNRCMPDASRQAPEPLDYEPPSHRVRSTPAQVAVGTLLACALIVGSIFVSIFVVFAQESGWGFLLACGVVLALCVVAVAVRKSKYPGLAQGIWFGIALAFLIEGICFLAKR